MSPVPDETTAVSRGPLPPAVRAAAVKISRELWHQAYRDGEGPMHHAGGPYWGNELLVQADRWERLAAAARVCGDWLGEGTFPEEQTDAT